MSLAISILFMAVGVGLFSRQITRRTWWFMGGWILVVLLYHFFKFKG